ncbi:HAD-IIA family hydrolase [Fredinandcohnia quinoae]|uniref:Acid sugar phosphatase n=1 Tax=Fredinandcohnia quinoae TaxID=2918902 RepID=A0AAW5E944_9BACI|nr:HAD-IIA family hydrolase [Fredinandcohnia sp. SECRCQ15]MCH1625284.1 HAD-IIA family hydrolase [Fredinandcohnia sp. SECRCQ15]
MIKDIEGFLIDIDGTIFRGDELIPGAVESINFLKALNKRVTYVSNRGNITRRTCYDRLKAVGVDVLEEEILLSSTVMAYFLKEHYPLSYVWTLGDSGLKEELVYHGVKISETPEKADFLIITLCETLTYHDLNQAFQAVQHGARILATNADKTFPNGKEKAIDVAGMIGAIEAASGRKTEVVIGKPSWFMVNKALAQLDVPAEKCMVIGDSLESDILMGNMHSMKTMLVLTGNTQRKHLESIPKRLEPDYIVDSIYSIVKVTL